MDLKDEKKACQLLCGVFPIYEATEFQTAVCCMVTDRESLMTTGALLSCSWNDVQCFRTESSGLAVSAQPCSAPPHCKAVI